MVSIMYSLDEKKKGYGSVRLIGGNLERLLKKTGVARVDIV